MTYKKLVESIRVELKDSGINANSDVVKSLLEKVFEIAWDEGYDTAYFRT